MGGAMVDGKEVMDLVEADLNVLFGLGASSNPEVSPSYYALREKAFLDDILCSLQCSDDYTHESDDF
jgi:hypothetical protein